MRIMLDTNVLISALLFPSQRMTTMMDCILSKHELILSSYVVEELKLVAKKKFPKKCHAMEALLLTMNYELVHTPEKIKENLFYIRDVKDYPVLYTAIHEDVDILISGDKDFAEIYLERPEILTPAQFMEKYEK